MNEKIGEGVDTVHSSISFSLAGQHIDNLVLTGTAATNATGNSLANALAGNGPANTLKGAGGSDTIAAGSDHDHLDGGLGSDTLNGGGGNRWPRACAGLFLRARRIFRVMPKT